MQQNSSHHKRQTFSIDGYKPGHPWFYVLGGKMLTPKEILTSAQNYECQGCRRDEIDKAARLSEPSRSERLRMMRAQFISELRSDLSCYREVARNLRTYRLKSTAVDEETSCEDIHVAASLKHNHIFYKLAHLIVIDDFLSEQPDLFD